MKHKKNLIIELKRHRNRFLLFLCLFGLCMLCVYAVPQKKRQTIQDEKVYLEHADELRRDMYGLNPDAQILKGHVRLKHKGAILTCDSAYLYQEANSVRAYGNVFFKQGDTLSLKGDRGFYDGMNQMLEVRKNVILKHRQQTLLTDSLNYDRLYNRAYFFDGGKLIDKQDNLVSDWGEYNTKSREAIFYYAVKLRSGKNLVNTDTLYYNTQKSLAHFKGPTTINSNGDVIKTTDGFFDTKKDKVQLYSRSSIKSGSRVITGDTLYRDKNTGVGRGFGNVVYKDLKNKNELHANVFVYNEKTGRGYATKQALLKDYSQGDTLFVHADSLRLETFYLNTDSVYRKVHGYKHVQAYRTDFQGVCDSLVINGKDSCLTMFYDPVLWTDNRQVLGERIRVYTNDSTLRYAHVDGQALSVEQMADKTSYNQVSAKSMEAFFHDGKLRKMVCTDNVRLIFYPINDADSTKIGLNYTETDTMRIFVNANRELERIWMPKAQGTIYPLNQIPTDKLLLPSFVWLDYLRPLSKNDIFTWRGKKEEHKLRIITRPSEQNSSVELNDKSKEEAIKKAEAKGQLVNGKEKKSKQLRVKRRR